MLTKRKPVRARLGKTKMEDLYAYPGDPINYLHMCPMATKKVFELKEHLEPFDTVKVELSGDIVKEE